MLGALKDLLAGLVFIAFGLAFGYASLGYDIGSALRMGPGYFPLFLSGILTVLGVVILVQGFFQTEESPIGPTPWLALVLLVGALFIFGFTVQGLGLVPSLMITVFMSAFASRHTGVLGAIALTIGLTLVCVLIFVYGLGLPLRLLGPWLDF
ncbi:tripartite tricarboxylate transporter TctB family protein [Rhodospirillaceae bacterium SYSU D60014]|uniref:tripartite tricarboxylate transporter TctB family protein n=1 Tax=Virgifigura deserti TaxID=2268457 RepID=UPI000E672012